MPTDTLEIEGTWEDILARQDELRGRRLRVSVIADESETQSFRPARGSSTGADLLKHAGSWTGDDLKETLGEVVRNRTDSDFTALASEESLARIWDDPAEDEAWAHL